MTTIYDIILVEDSESDAEIIMRALKRAQLQFGIRHLVDGEKALEYFENGMMGNVYPKLILLDMKMPKVDGLEVIRHIRGSENFRAVPLVVLSSSREEKDIQRAYQLGANSYLVKPVDYDGFSNLVVNAVSYWMNLNQTAG